MHRVSQKIDVYGVHAQLRYTPTTLYNYNLALGCSS